MLQRIPSERDIDRLKLPEEIVWPVGTAIDTLGRDKVCDGAHFWKLVGVFLIGAEILESRLHTVRRHRQGTYTFYAQFEVPNNRAQGGRVHRQHLLEGASAGAVRGVGIEVVGTSPASPEFS